MAQHQYQLAAQQSTKPVAQNPTKPPRQRKEKATTTAKNSTTATTQSNARDHRSANVGQTRAPGVTPGALQQQAKTASSYSPHQRLASVSESTAPTTVDPSQVYDPWPEQQRRIREAEARRKADDEERARKEAEEKKIADAARAKQEAEDAEKRRAEDAEKRRSKDERKERKAAEEVQKQLRQEHVNAVEAFAKAKILAAAKSAQAVSQSEQPAQSHHPADMASLAGAGGAPPGSDLEAEMLAMFKKMREFNEKNPVMLARLWDQELRAHIANTSSPAPSTNQPASTSAQRVPPPPSTEPAAAAAAPKPPPAAARASSTKTAVPTTTAPNANTSAPAKTSSAKKSKEPDSHPSASGLATPAGVTSRQGGVPLTGPSANNAIWPPSKKVQLARAAARWLNAQPGNIDKITSSNTVISLLDANPSYLTLCETLEAKGLAVDRAAFARALLGSVPDVNKNHPSSSSSANATESTNNTGSVAATDVVAGPADAASSILAVPQSSLEPSRKRKTPGIGKFGSARGRPRKDGQPAQQRTNNDGTSRALEKRKGAQQSTPSDLSAAALVAEPSTSTAGPSTTGPSTIGPSLAKMYEHALAGGVNVVDYQSDLGFHPPPDDDYYQPPVEERPSSGKRTTSYSSPYFNQAVGEDPAQQTNRQPSGVTKPTPPQAPSRPPANKEEAARKRTFAELVDLTAMDSDSEDELAITAKYPKLSHVRDGDNVSPAVHATPGLSASLGTKPFRHYMYNGSLSNGFSHQTPVVGTAPQAPMQIHAQTSNEPELLNLEPELKGKILVQGIERDKVARKSHYDPRTICRDVLLATGRHPEMRALNQHLFDMHEFLKHHSFNIEGDKLDLATIRWDLIDPGEPILEPAKEDDKSSEEEVDADDEGDGDSSHMMPQSLDDKKAVRNDSSNQENSQRSNTDLDRRRKPFAKKKDRRPGGPGMSLPNFKSRVLHDGGESSDQLSRPHMNAALNTRESLTPHARPGASFTPVNKTSKDTMESTPLPVPTGYAAFNQINQQLDEYGNPIKRKGRPVGWRKSIHSKAAVNGELPAPSPAKRKAQGSAPDYSSGSRRRGGPSEPVYPMPRDPSPTFNVYKCEWEECKTELHNIDTLRKHMIKLHGKPGPEGDFECFWSDCFKDRSGPEDVPFFFDSMGEWMEHVEAAHIKPMARKLGDGPRIGLSGSTSSS